MRNFLTVYGKGRLLKNLLLLAVIAAMFVPVCAAVSLRRSLSEISAEAAAQRETLSLYSDALKTAQHQLLSLSKPEETKVQPEPFGEAPSYQALYPDFYAPQPLTAATRTPGVIYLTFDDGPSVHTPEILEILAKKDVKATFFVIGSKTEQAQAWLRDIADAGHTVGMHSYTHQYLEIYDSVEAYLADMYALFCQIRDVTGEAPSVFRFPGGSINGYNRGIYQELMAEMLRRGFVPYDWNLSNGDATGKPLTAAESVSNVVNGARRVERGIVLMHDTKAKGSTVSSLEAMIDQLRELGFTLDRLTPEIQPVLYDYK